MCGDVWCEERLSNKSAYKAVGVGRVSQSESKSSIIASSIVWSGAVYIDQDNHIGLAGLNTGI